MEPVKGTHAVRNRAAKEFFEGLPSEEEALAVALGAYGSNSKKENRDAGEGSSHGVLCPIFSSLSPKPIPIPPPREKPSLEKVTKDLHQQFGEGRQTFLSGGRVPWLGRQMENSLEPHIERGGIGYMSILDVDDFLDHVVSHL